MKQFKNLLFLSLILLCWTLVSCKSSKTSSGWSLIWEENFNQKKSFDSQVWSKIPRGKSDWNNYMTDFDSCYAMRKGKLVLRGIVNHTAGGFQVLCNEGVHIMLNNGESLYRSDQNK